METDRQAAGHRQGRLFEELRQAPANPTPLARDLLAFRRFGRKTAYATTVARSGDRNIVADTYINEFWTSAQRAAHRLHEISYRACFKPQIPAFFIDRLTRAGELVYDPFMGRGTTPLEAALRGRIPAGNDANPLSAMLLRPRLMPPEPDLVEARLAELDLRWEKEIREDLLVFYHEDTLRQITALKAWFERRESEDRFDDVDDWIRMVATNRLTGHSPGFFSVYTLPPNQATSVQAQRRINERRKQVPPARDVKKLILKKTASLLGGTTAAERAGLRALGAKARICCGPAECTPRIEDGSVALVVTSPPFLDVVQYETDNWLRTWFCGIESEGVRITMARTVEAWADAMGPVFAELHRVVRRGGYVAFEVGEVRRRSVRLEEVVIPVALREGFRPELVLINDQRFTKTANCWGIDNNQKGTNTNRVVLLRR
ncbi:MAG: DNA methylase [Planctomycetota bacterium]